MADSLLIDQVSFKDNVAVGLERPPDLINPRALQIIEIHDQVVSGSGKFNLLQVRKVPFYLK